MPIVTCKQRSVIAARTTGQEYARKIVGPAIDYAEILVDRDLLQKSMPARRDHAWKVYESVIQPITIQIANGTSKRSLSIPKFMTWYDRAEFRAMFRHLYTQILSKNQQEAVRSSNPQKWPLINKMMIEKVFTDFYRKDISDNWPDARFNKVLDALVSDQDLAGAGQPVIADGMLVLFSPALIAHYLENFAFVYHCDELPKPPTSDTVPAFAHCFSKPFPKNAVAIKATFNERRKGAAVFDTGIEAMRAHLNKETNPGLVWLPSYAEGGKPKVADFRSDDASEQVFHINLRNQEYLLGEFVMTGLHITTKETPEWVWITLWWSNDPLADFGRDRPATINAPWNQYKLCVATHWDEGDKTAGEGSSWCSNPYIETMKYGASSNCIGCHQFAGTKLTKPKEPLIRKYTNSFPADFLTSYDQAADGGGFKNDIDEVITAP